MKEVTEKDIDRISWKAGIEYGDFISKEASNATPYQRVCFEEIAGLLYNLDGNFSEKTLSELADKEYPISYLYEI